MGGMGMDFWNDCDERDCDECEFRKFCTVWKDLDDTDKADGDRE